MIEESIIQAKIDFSLLNIKSGNQTTIDGFKDDEESPKDDYLGSVLMTKNDKSLASVVKDVTMLEV